jgi:hypothetical protein
MTTFVAARAVAALDVIIELALCFGRDLVAVYGGFEIGPLDTGRELAGLFVVGAAREVGIGRVFRLVALFLVFHLISFFT